MQLRGFFPASKFFDPLLSRMLLSSKEAAAAIIRAVNRNVLPRNQRAGNHQMSQYFYCVGHKPALSRLSRHIRREHSVQADICFSETLQVLPANVRVAAVKRLRGFSLHQKSELSTSAVLTRTAALSKLADEIETSLHGINGGTLKT